MDVSFSSVTLAKAQSFHHQYHPSKFPPNQASSRNRKSSIQSFSVEVSTAASLSLKSSFDDTEDEEDSCARTDFGLESPTIVSHLIQTVRKESKMTTEPRHSHQEIPPPLGFDDFQTLSSTKQNIELFKILSAIAEEIEEFKSSTEQRFQALETLIQHNKTDIYGALLPPSKFVGNGNGEIVAGNGKSRSDCSSQLRGSSDQEVELAPTRPASWPRDPGPPQDEPRDIELAIIRNAAEDRPVLLNIGGVRFEVTWELLDKLPQSRLGRLRKCRNMEEILEVCDGYDPDRNEFTFHRQPRNFNSVLNFMRTGKLHLGEETCVIAFSQDLEYWNVDELYLEQCCVQKYYQQRELLTWDMGTTKKEDELEIFRAGRLGRLQKILWDLFERPHTSIGARVVAIISITFIVLSTVVLTLNTLPYFDKRDENNNERDYPPFALLEAIYMSWFTFEFLIRLVACPSKIKFVKSPMNVIDLLAILPYYVSIALVNSTSVGQLTEVRRIAQFFRIMRILRIFKLARHSVGLQSLGFTIRNSYKELGLLLLFMSISVLIFSSLVFVFEKDETETTFNTMLDAYWWAVITMTTVGYGDISPTTIFGKFIGSLCAICGVLVIALPIPIIGNNFAAFYKNERRREALSEKKAAMERMRRKGAITPFPRQNGFGSDRASNSETEAGKPMDITELDAESLGFETINRESEKSGKIRLSEHRRSIQNMNGISGATKAGPMPHVSQ